MHFLSVQIICKIMHKRLLRNCILRLTNNQRADKKNIKLPSSTEMVSLID